MGKGKLAEGINFSDELARAVFVIGIPYPPMKDKQIEYKREYLDYIYRNKSIKLSSKKINGYKWYKMQAMRAMNQSIGRVIRHKDDYGAIFLVDKRFNTVK